MLVGCLLSLKNVRTSSLILLKQIIITHSPDGQAYGWGRNESGQLGLGYSSPCVPVPTALSVPDDVQFVSAGVGKYHTLLVTADGNVYASGGNKCGQLGVNNEKLEGCDKFRKCAVVDYGGEEEDGVKIVHVSFALLNRFEEKPILAYTHKPVIVMHV